MRSQTCACTVEEIAAILPIGRSSACALVKKGLFKRVRIGTAIRISGRSFGRVTGAIVIQRSAPWRGCGALLCMIAKLFV
ncbi:helix-turn-helix domain-containing protein [Dysosmobacter sp. Marseille-Q4140]|nr:helix-turn-helix domain-containing protein [Dysosmobacter sp. Marseille-Q4140]